MDFGNALGIIGGLIGSIGGTLGIIVFFRDYVGKFDIFLTFEKGESLYPNKNHIERHTNLVITVIKRGKASHAILSATIETRIINPAQGDPFDLNEYLKLDDLVGISLDQHKVKVVKKDFISQSNHGIEGAFTLLEIRVVIKDTRNRTYVSNWANYNDYIKTITNPPISEIS